MASQRECQRRPRSRGDTVGNSPETGGKVYTVRDSNAAFTPAQQVARNLLLSLKKHVARNTQLVAGNKQLAARNMMLVARNKLRWCKRGIRVSAKERPPVMGW